MKHHNLNTLYSKYKQGIFTRCEFEGFVYQYLANNQDKTRLNQWKFDEYEDFLSWFYQRLPKAIDAYQETIAPFDVYINSVMRTAAKEFRAKTVTKRIIEYSAWCAQVPEFYVQDEAPPFSTEDESSEKTMVNMLSKQKIMDSPKQLLALILKCYYYISDDFVDRIAENTGLKKGKLSEMINKLRSLRQKKDDEVYFMKERMHCQYYRCIVYERWLSFIPENTTAHIRLKQRLDKARQRLEKMRKRIANIRTDATNRQVADVIGVSKGTIDSSLFRLKVKWGIMSKNALLN